MPLKEGSLPTDKEVDISAASQTDRSTCNKLLCKLGYSREDDVRYPKILQQVFGRLRTEENGDAYCKGGWSQGYEEHQPME
jgi:hypothetical protein